MFRFKREKGKGRRLVLPNGATWNPECFVLLLLYLGLYLVSYQHQVGPGVDGVWQQVFVFSLQLQSVLVDILGVLLGDFLGMIPRVFNLEMGNENKTVTSLTGPHLFNLFDTLELDQ